MAVKKKTKKAAKPKGYAVPLDPDVVADLKEYSEASSIPVVRIVNRILRESLDSETTPAFLAAASAILDRNK